MTRASVELDHLVIAAATLADGVAWCEATFGITPGPGGKHALMGTHNRLFGIGSARFQRAYFELIAIDPEAAPPGRARWFDLDDPALQRAIGGGPKLIHWVARCDDVHAQVQTLREAGIARGDVLQAERATPGGTLRWQITVRADGQRLFDGALPTLIQWGRDGAFEAHAPSPASGSGMQAAARTAGDVHPADTLPASGVTLEHLSLCGIPASVAAWLPSAFAIQAAPHSTGGTAAITATLSTPRGPVILESFTIEVTDVQP